MNEDPTQQYVPPQKFRPRYGRPYLAFTKAENWIVAYRKDWGHLPTSGQCPAFGVGFSFSTFNRALRVLKEEGPTKPISQL